MRKTQVTGLENGSWGGRAPSFKVCMRAAEHPGRGLEEPEELGSCWLVSEPSLHSCLAHCFLTTPNSS